MAAIAWIGAGVMGRPMAGHLAAHGHLVRVYSRHMEKLTGAEQEGLEPCATIAQAVAGAEYVFVMVGYPRDVEEVFAGPGGIFESAAPGTLAVDMTTSLPELARRLWEQGKEKGIRVLDAPVSGGDRGARNASLSIMVGGEKADFEEVRPLLSCMGTGLHYMGQAGSGQHTKMANQIVIAGTMCGVSEALIYGAKAGLDLEKMVATISKGAAGCWTLDNLAPRVLKGDYAPGFMVEHFIKDMGIALEEAEMMELSLPSLALARQLYLAVKAQGCGRNGTQVLVKALESLAGKEIL